MAASKTILKATFLLLKEQFKKPPLNGKLETLELIKKLSKKLHKEWNIIKEKIIFEAERIEKKQSSKVSSEKINLQEGETISPQVKIDKMRKKIAKLTIQIEEIN